MERLKSCSILLMIIVLSSCATLRKDSSSRVDEQKNIDTSSQVHNYQKETITEEKGSTPIITEADSVQNSGTISAEDTTTHQQTTETDDMSLTTTVTPKVKDGKITGYDVNSKAVSKPKTVNIPVDRKTTTKETGTDKVQTGITNTKKEVVTASKKERTGFNAWGSVVIVGVIILFLLFVFFKLWK
jgi:hypothetical protein